MKSYEDISPAVEIENTPSRGRCIPRIKPDHRIFQSRTERISYRNTIMTARYYYWTELKRRRFDDTIRILADNEFFVEDRTITNALINCNDYFRELAQNRTTTKSLREMFPGWDWS